VSASLRYRFERDLSWEGRIVDEDVSDGLLIDVRGMDISSLLNDLDESSVITALDRLLTSDADRCNDFDSYI
jgi:hypothetical protein